MTTASGRLRAIVARYCSVTTMERLVDPIVADLEMESRNARSGGRVWKARCVLVTGYVGLARALLAHGAERIVCSLRDFPPGDRQAVASVMRIAAVTMAVVTALLLMPVLRSSRDDLTLQILLIPQALALSPPVAITIGILYGLGGRRVSFRLAGSVLALAFIAASISFASVGWLVPASSQAYRETVARRIYAKTGAKADVGIRGATELALTELREQIDVHTKAGREVPARRLRLAYHRRWALPFAALALALLAVSMTPRRQAGPATLAVLAVSIIAGYYLLMLAGETFSRQESLPAFVAAWFPNLACAVLSAVLVSAGACRRAPSDRLSSRGA
jgi:hypothetical protein